MVNELIIKVERFNDPDLPEKYLASIPSKPGMVVSGSSVGDVLHELSISCDVWEDHEKKSIID